MRFKDLLRRVSELPAVEAAALSTRAPLDSSTPTVHVSPRDAVSATSDSTATTVSFLVISPRYFDVVKTPVVAGRAFTDRDDEHGASAVVVNQTLAGRLWPGADAIGRRLWLDPRIADSPAVVVGIARDSKYLTVGEEHQGHVYLPFAQHPRAGMALLIRSSQPPPGLANAVQAVLHAIDPNLQGFFTRTLTD